MNKQYITTDFSLDDKSERRLAKITTELQKRHNISSTDALDAIFLMGILSISSDAANITLEPEEKEKIERALKEIVASNSRGDEEGYVYILKAETEDIFKVGITRGDPFHRVKTIQSGCPYKLDIYAYMSCRDCRVKETELCNILNQYRMHGEWFSVPPAIIDELIVQESVRVQLSGGAHDSPSWICMDIGIAKRRDAVFNQLGISAEHLGD